MAHVLPELHSLFDIFPCFRTIPTEEWAAAKPHLRSFPAKSTLFRSDDAVHYTLFLISGTVQILNLTEGGREALTNRLSAGDICAMMVLSGLSDREYPGTITAETEVTVMFVEKKAFLHWIQVYAPIRNAVFGNILDGLIQLGSLLSDKMSQPLDFRLAETLLKLTSAQQPTVRITHQQLAVELGSAREVVSRVMGRMKKKGWIETGRGVVTVRQRGALTELIGDQVTEAV
ncbi:cAMP-activated global transcriptional regulator CRP [Paenibacillus plantiphilus]|uniref:cAMP-activated global transcriptional regulator CRP n=2 Tax=Paenibacillus plantiphilus TaxID=2905650 RepID=A0ABN8GAD4_9BACL|nr:cAMP-activated global transcriptional regulator CRP [Paenibacillus plantiphilus]